MKIHLDAIGAAFTYAALPFTNFIPTMDLQDPDFWIRLALAVVGPVLTFALGRLFFAGARAARALSKGLRGEARRLLTDKDPENDLAGRALETVADAIDAGATGLEGGKTPEEATQASLRVLGKLKR